MDVDIAQSGNVNSQQSRNGDDYMLPNNVIEYQTDEDMWEHVLQSWTMASKKVWAVSGGCFETLPCLVSS